MGTKKSVSVIRRLLKGIKGLQLLRVSFFGERGEEAPKGIGGGTLNKTLPSK